MSQTITAAFLVIGDEILSGRTKDKNIGVIADFLTAHAIELCEVRIVSDDEGAIIAAVNALRAQYQYLFTSGGIGPTHDDITAISVSKAFGVPCTEDARAVELLEAHYKSKNVEFSDARRRMTRMPKGSKHIDNAISIAPGFIKENVYVMAGVPQIFQSMLETLSDKLETGSKIYSQTIPSPLPEGTIATALGEIQRHHEDVNIGSYPIYKDGNTSTNLVVRGTDMAKIDATINAIKEMLVSL